MSEFVKLTADRDYLLTQSRKACFAAETVTATAGRSRNLPVRTVTVAAAAAAAGVTASQVGDARRLGKSRPDLFEKVKAGQITLGQARYAAGEMRSTTTTLKGKRSSHVVEGRTPLAPRPAPAAALALLIRNLSTVVDECGGPDQAAALALFHGLSVDGRKVARTYEFLGALAAAMEAGQAA